MPCPTKNCACESPALRAMHNRAPKAGDVGILFGPCECTCHAIAAAELLGLNPTEVLFGFVSWLTTRPKAVALGAKIDSAPAADLLREYCHVNGLPDTRQGWEQKIRKPLEDAPDAVEDPVEEAPVEETTGA